MRYATATLCLSLSALLACEHKHEHEGAHGGEHAHGPKGEHEAPPERPDLSVTKYQSGLELFMEYPAFVAGEASPLIAHFTDARDPNGFRAITRGRVTAIL